MSPLPGQIVLAPAHGVIAKPREKQRLTNDCMTACRPDGKKKAFLRLTPDVDALDIAATKLAIV